MFDQRRFSKEWNQVFHSVKHQLQTHPAGAQKSWSTYPLLFTYTLNQPTCCTYNFWPHFAKLSLIFLNSSKINSSPWLINYNMIVFKIFFMAYYNRWASHWHDWELLGFGRWAFGCWSSGLWGFWDIEILDLGHWCVGLLRHMDMNIVYYNVLNLTFAH